VQFEAAFYAFDLIHNDAHIDVDMTSSDNSISSCDQHRIFSDSSPMAARERAPIMNRQARPPKAIAIGLAIGALTSQLAAAQDWPSRPVTMVVPLAAGSGIDVLGRIFAPRLAELLGQQVIVENVSGAGGMTGASRVAKAAPDGYQFVLGGTGTHAHSQTLFRNPLYNAATDFAPVALIAEQPIVLIARKDMPVGNLQQFISYAKANQAKMQYGSAGAGSAAHLACVLVNAAIGSMSRTFPIAAADRQCRI
jgi:tripartite-type tricarboxylate transporter receptor subunit TctC